jgi:hypothetical protein
MFLDVSVNPDIEKDVLHDNATALQRSLSSNTVVGTTRQLLTMISIAKSYVRATYAVNVIAVVKDATVAAKHAPANQTKLAIRLTADDGKQAANLPGMVPHVDRLARTLLSVPQISLSRTQIRSHTQVASESIRAKRKQGQHRTFNRMKRAR